MINSYGYDRDEFWPWFNLSEVMPDVRYEGFVNLLPTEYAAFQVAMSAAITWQERLKQLTGK